MPGQDARQYYDHAARDWDAKHGADRQNPFFAARLRKNLQRLLASRAGAGLALELGAGTGPYLGLISPLFARVLATDLSPAMVEGLSQRIRENGWTNVTAQTLDAMTLAGVPDAGVDVITFVGLLETIADLPGLFRRMQRALAPGGMIVGTTSNGASPYYALRKRFKGGEEHARTGTYLTWPAIVSLADAAGLTPGTALHWGVCPPGLGNPVAGRALDLLETALAPTPLARRLGVISFQLFKPA